MGKKRLLAILLVILLYIFPIYAQQTDYNDYTALEVEFDLSSEFSLYPTSTSYELAYVSANLTFYPQTLDNQRVISLKTRSSPQINVMDNKDSIIYMWNKPPVYQFSYGVNSKIDLINTIAKIEEKIKMPNIDNEYTKASGLIDMNDDIKNKAKELASGEDDLYFIAFKIADWVENNIQYNLSTLTADVVQPSSWVLIHKEGVCDELTNLLVSMMRSLGVPAKLISGMAYTNTRDEWGPHAWAEVYFPDKGWVPFDITYKQFGWIDPTHLKLMDSIDSSESSVKYNYKSYNMEFKGEEIKLNTKLLKLGEKIAPLARIELKPLKNNVGPGSYVPIEVSLKNINEYYLPETVFVTKPPGLTEKNAKSILLKPSQNGRIFWIVKIPEETEENYMYSTIIEVHDMFHDISSDVINYASDYQTISLDEANNIIKNLIVEETNAYSKDIDINCNSNKRYYFNYENGEVKCLLKSDKMLNGLNVCLLDDCKIVDVNKENEVRFELKDLPEFTEKVKVSAKNNDIDVNNYVDVMILESPELRVSNLNNPFKLDYNEDFNLDFTISSKAPVKYALIKINGNDVYELENFNYQQKISVPSSGKDFAWDDSIIIEFDYYDENSKHYREKRAYPIGIMNTPWYMKILKPIRNLF